MVHRRGQAAARGRGRSSRRRGRCRHLERRAARRALRRGPTRARHAHGLGASVGPDLGLVLDGLALAEGAEAVDVDGGLLFWFLWWWGRWWGVGGGGGGRGVSGGGGGGSVWETPTSGGSCSVRARPSNVRKSAIGPAIQAFQDRTQPDPARASRARAASVEKMGQREDGQRGGAHSSPPPRPIDQATRPHHPSSPPGRKIISPDAQTGPPRPAPRG